MIVALVVAFVGLSPAVVYAQTQSQGGTEATDDSDWYFYVLEESQYNKFVEVDPPTEGSVSEDYMTAYDENGVLHYYKHEYVKDDKGNVIEYPCYKVVRSVKGRHKEGDTSSYTFGSLKLAGNQFFCIKKGNPVAMFDREGITPARFSIEEGISSSLITTPVGTSQEIKADGTIYYCGNKDHNDKHLALDYSTLVFKPGTGTLYMKKPVFLEYTAETSAGLYNDVFHEELETYDGTTWTLASAQFVQTQHCTITYMPSHDVYESHENLTADSFGKETKIDPAHGFVFTDNNHVCSLKVRFVKDDSTGHFYMTPTGLTADHQYYLVTLKPASDTETLVTKYDVTGSRHFEHFASKEIKGVTYENVYELPGSLLMDKDAYFAISSFVPTAQVKRNDLQTISAYDQFVDITMAVGLRNHCKFSDIFYGKVYIIPDATDVHKFKAYFEKKSVRDETLNGENLGAVTGYPLLDKYVDDPEKGLKADVPDDNGDLTFRPILHQNELFKPDANGNHKYYEFTVKDDKGNPVTKYVKLEYFDQRIALTGNGCSVNRIAGGGLANVATANTDLFNIVSPKLEDAGSITNGIGVSLATAPLVSVRDKDHYYAKGTTAGFNVIAGSGTKVLSLDVIKLMSIAFYRDGKLMAVKPVDTKTGAGLDLSLISISNNESSFDMTATAPCVFDEIAIYVAGGIELNVGDNFQVKYAFVGNSPEVTIGTTGLTAYNAKVAEADKIKVQEHSTTFDAAGIEECNFVGAEAKSTNIINTANLLLGGVGWARVCLDYEKPDNHLTGDVFKKGDRVHFKINGASVLSLGIGTGSTITFYKRLTSVQTANNLYKVSYEKCQDVVLNAKVLDLGVVSVNGDQVISMEAPCDFSGVKLTLNGGLVNLGATNVYYASVTPAPVVRHECDLKFPTDVYLNKTVKKTYYWLNTSEGTEKDPDKDPNPLVEEIIPDYTPDAALVPEGETLTWTLTKPEGSGVKFNETTGGLSDFDISGDYVLTYKVKEAESSSLHADCKGSITVHYMAAPKYDEGNTILGEGSTARLLTDTESDASKYSYTKKVVKDNTVQDVTVYRKVAPVKISIEGHGTSGGIIIGEEGVNGTDNIIDGKNDTFAKIKMSVSLIENAFLVAVKTKDGSNMIQTVDAPATPQAVIKKEGTATGAGSGTEEADYNDVRVGFLVQSTVDGVDLSALDFYNIRVYKNGEEIYGHVIEQSTGVDVGLGDTEPGKVVRCSVVVPKDKIAKAGGFDEFALWLSGTANITLSEIRVYGAFVEEIDPQSASHLPNMCSNKHIITGGSVYPKVTGAAANVASNISNLSFLTDYDPEFKTAMTVAPAVGAGNGQVIEVKFAEKIPAYQQVALVVDNATFALGATVGDWLKVRCISDDADSTAEAGVEKIAAKAEENKGTEEFTDWGVLGAKIGSGDSESNKAALVFTPTHSFDRLQIETANIVNALDSQEFYGICTQGDADGNGVPDCFDTDFITLRTDEVRDIKTGIENLETYSSGGVIRVESCGDGTARVHADYEGVDEVTVYDILGTRHSVISGNGSYDVTVALPYEICILKVELEDGSQKTFKVHR